MNKPLTSKPEAGQARGGKSATGRSKWRQATRLVRGGTKRSGFAETSEGLFLTSGYVYDNAAQAEDAFKGRNDRYIYSRYGNPTVAMFEERMAQLEGAEAAFATASGMAAVFTSLICQLHAGDRVVASRALFGSCHYIIAEILPRFGIETVLVDGTKPDAWEAALAKPTTAVFLETPSNPTLEIIDLAHVAELTHGAGGRLVVDNVFATPLLQAPMDYGADVVMYSATKHIDGQGRCLGGVILSDKAFYEDLLMPFMRHTGPALSPFNAWTLLKGLETLPLRVERHLENARAVAAFLEDHAKVSRVLYPELASHPQHDLAAKQMSAGGSVVSFEIPGGKREAFTLLDHFGLVDISNNLGDAKSLVTHPATTTHQRLTPEERAEQGIGDGLVRLSVGLEDVQDIIEGLDRGLAAL
jgi:O-succinylhomoserine sulfhydrylase